MHGIINCSFTESHSWPSQTSKVWLFENVNCFLKKPHVWCLAGFWILVCFIYFFICLSGSFHRVIAIFQLNIVNPLSANPTKWSNTLKQSVWAGFDSLSVFDHFVGLGLKGLNTVNQLLESVLYVYPFTESNAHCSTDFRPGHLKPALHVWHFVANPKE